MVGDLQALASFLGGTIPLNAQEITVPILNGDRQMARLLYTVNEGNAFCVHILDGIDTIIIERGKIVAITMHGFVSFTR